MKSSIKHSLPRTPMVLINHNCLPVDVVRSDISYIVVTPSGTVALLLAQEKHEHNAMYRAKRLSASKYPVTQVWQHYVDTERRADGWRLHAQFLRGHKVALGVRVAAATAG